MGYLSIGNLRMGNQCLVTVFCVLFESSCSITTQFVNLVASKGIPKPACEQRHSSRNFTQNKGLKEL